MSKMEIYAGLPWSSDITIISDDGLTGEQLDPADTGTFMIQTAGISPQCVIEPTAMTIVDADNGIMNITLTAEQTALLEQDVGFAEDLHPTQSLYKGIMSFTLVSGNRDAMADIYVRETAVCPVNP